MKGNNQVKRGHLGNINLTPVSSMRTQLPRLDGCYQHTTKANSWKAWVAASPYQAFSRARIENLDRVVSKYTAQALIEHQSNLQYEQPHLQRKARQMRRQQATMRALYQVQSDLSVWAEWPAARHCCQYTKGDEE